MKGNFHEPMYYEPMYHTMTLQSGWRVLNIANSSVRSLVLDSATPVMRGDNNRGPGTKSANEIAGSSVS